MHNLSQAKTIPGTGGKSAAWGRLLITPKHRRAHSYCLFIHYNPSLPPIYNYISNSYYTYPAHTTGVIESEAIERY
jgi:hypothetical protein